MPEALEGKNNIRYLNSRVLKYKKYHRCTISYIEELIYWQSFNKKLCAENNLCYLWTGLQLSNMTTTEAFGFCKTDDDCVDLFYFCNSFRKKVLCYNNNNNNGYIGNDMNFISVLSFDICRFSEFLMKNSSGACVCPFVPEALKQNNQHNEMKSWTNATNQTSTYETLVRTKSTIYQVVGGISDAFPGSTRDSIHQIHYICSFLSDCQLPESQKQSSYFDSRFGG